MSKGVNEITLIGNLGNDPEVKYTQGGMCITTISLATTSNRKDREGNKIEKTQWHRVKLFGKLGEIAGEFLKKGRQVYIKGEVDYSTSGEGDNKRYYTDIIANDMQMLGSGNGNGNGERSNGGNESTGSQQSGYGNRAARTKEAAPAPREPALAGDFDDQDIPF